MTVKIRTASMDEVPHGQGVRIKIQHHAYDMHNLAEDVAARITATLIGRPQGCVYFTPITTVSCQMPTAAFFRQVRREQARWCRQSSSTFPRKIRRRSSNWVSGGEWIGDKFARYLDRALCFTGILFIDGTFIQPHLWPEPTTGTGKVKRNGSERAR